MPHGVAGTVTFLFTDVEGSTRLLQLLGRDDYRSTLAEHQALMRAAFAGHGGTEIDTQGDAFFVAFATASDAVAAVVEAQRSLVGHAWPAGVEVRVRMGLHTGEALVEEGRYTGVAVHRAQRICSAGHGGQVLLSNATREVVEDDLPPDVGLRDLGERRLKDLDRPVRVFQLQIDGLQNDFPPIKTEEEIDSGAAAARRRKRALAGTAMLIAGAAAVAVAVGFVLLRDGGGGPGPPAANSLAVIDAASGRIVEGVPVGATPAAVSAGEGAVWVLNADDQTISKVDPESYDVTSFGTGATPTDLSAGAGALWVGNGRPLAAAQFTGPVATAIARVDPASNTVRSTTPLPRTGGAISNLTDYHVAAGSDAVWAIAPDYSISRIDPSTGRVLSTIREFAAIAVAASGKDAWAIGEESVVAKLAADGSLIAPYGWQTPSAVRSPRSTPPGTPCGESSRSARCLEHSRSRTAWSGSR